jgi:hypothetical protein
MHSSVAAGKLTTISFDDANKRIEVCAKIVDKGELEKLIEGLYTGFSIGGKYEKRWPDEGDKKLTRYTAVPSELSIVDNPCIPSATFSCVKEDGSTEMRKFHVPPAETTPAATPPAAEALPDLAQVWQAKDGKTFSKKSEAEAHNEALAKVTADATTPAGQLAAALAGLTGDVAKLSDAAPGGVTKKDFTDDERKKLADSGEAMKDGSYPIQSKADLANAIKAFGRAKNKKAVKAHIQTRAKSLNAEDALPDSWKPGADKALRFGDLRKGLDTVARFAGLLQELDWLQSSCEYEAEYEGDNSTVPASLKQNIAALAATLRAMTEEETNELLDEGEALEFGEMLEMSAAPKGLDALVKLLGTKAPAVLAKAGMRHGKADAEHLAAAHDAISALGVAKCSGMGKAGARHSKADAQHLLDAHNSLTKAGALCPAKDAKDGTEPAKDEAEKAAGATLTKALEDERTKTVALEKTMTEAVTAIADLRAQVAKFAKTPMPRPHERLMPAVTKGAPGEADDLAAVLAKMTPEERNEFARSLPRHLTR